MVPEDKILVIECVNGTTYTILPVDSLAPEWLILIAQQVPGGMGEKVCDFVPTVHSFQHPTGALCRYELSESMNLRIPPHTNVQLRVHWRGEATLAPQRVYISGYLINAQ